MKRYIAITPARDEEKFLPGLIDSMARQTCLPERWIIIDDASTDSTAEIIDSAAKIYSWIEPDHLEQRTKRAAGGGESSTVATRIMHFLTGNAFERDQFTMAGTAFPGTGTPKDVLERLFCGDRRTQIGFRLGHD